jgi:predicted enzyme related to lactoylglutathione lyase
MPTAVHFDIPPDDLERAKSFYAKLFGRKFERPMEPMEYYLMDTEDLEGKPGLGGGLGKRQSADQRIMNYIGVNSVDEYLLKVEKLGGKVLMPKTVVPGWGYLAICTVTENSTFGLWEDDGIAKE